MAVIDIDRHIVTDLVGIQSKIEYYQDIADRHWQKLMKLDNEEKVFYQEKDTKEAEKVRQKKEKEITKAHKCWLTLVSLHSQNKALLMHIINRIEKVDTGKGAEVGHLDRDEES